jgi:hypothetical protein
MLTLSVSVTTWALSCSGEKDKNNKMIEINVRNLRMLSKGSKNVFFPKGFRGLN